jgi:predicted NUDIX family NTP pyrophosphohydrolase
MSARVSAGILLFRRRAALGGGSAEPERLQVLLAHPGGPYFARRDAGAWTLPKGLAQAEEALEAVARREFAEETGARLGPGVALLPLGTVRQQNGKIVHAWAAEGDLDPETARSNTFEVEWPPRSGTIVTYPEIDRVAWFDLAEGRRRIVPAQAAFIDRLEERLAGQTQGADATTTGPLPTVDPG